MLMLDLTPSVWIVWAIIGIVGGYMCGRLLSRGISMPASVVAGIVAATLGGWLTTLWLGSEDTGIYLSLVGAVILMAVVLWLCRLAAGRRRDAADD